MNKLEIEFGKLEFGTSFGFNEKEPSWIKVSDTEAIQINDPDEIKYNVDLDETVFV